MGLFNHIHEIFDDNKLLQENSIYQLIIFGPASIISTIVGIPFLVLSFIFIPLGYTVQKLVTKISLYLNHSISMGYLYSAQEYFFDTFELHDVLIGTILAFFGFYKTIKKFVNETLNKTFPN